MEEKENNSIDDVRQLTNVEAQRVLNVLDEAVDKISILSDITMDINMSSRLLSELPSNIAMILKNQLRMEMEKRENKKNTDYEIEDHTRAICRAFCNDPIQRVKLKEYRGKRSASMISFHRCMEELRDLVRSTLLKTIDHEENERERLKDIQTHILEAEDDCQHLSEELQKENDTHAANMERFEFITNKLKMELKDGEESAEQIASVMEHEANQREFSAMTKFEATTGKLNERADKLTGSCQNVRDDAKNKEDTLRRRINKNGQELITAVKKFDTDMINMQSEIDRLTELHRAEAKEVERLTEYFKKVDEDKKYADEEDRLIRRAQLAEQTKREKIIDRGITILQAHIRGFLCRRRILRKAQPKKTGKKGKKGGLSKK